MIRTGFLAIPLVLCACLLVAAQDGPAPKKVDPDLVRDAPDFGKEIPKLEKGDPAKVGDPAAKGESPQEIIERIHKNLDLASTKLKDQSDPTEPTRKVMKDIIDDLDKLIKQQQDNESC